nr:intercellular adhesion molecule 2 [Manis javanica]
MPLGMSAFCCWGLPVALLTLLCSPGSGEKAFEVHIWPKQLVVEPGGSWVINCSTSCAHPDAGGLETTLPKTVLTEQTQWKQYKVSNVSNATVAYCHFTCSGKQKSEDLRISTYRPPKQVLLKLQPTWVAVGRPFTIECRVPDVIPLENLTITLLRGNETLHIKTFGRMHDSQEARATHSITAHREDSHHNFSCQAELDLRSLGGEVVRCISEPQALMVYEPMQDNQMAIIITVVAVLLFLFVTSVLLCFVFGQHWLRKRMGSYRVGKREAQRS